MNVFLLFVAISMSYGLFVYRQLKRMNIAS